MVWETLFFREFKPKDGIQRNKSWEYQSRNKEVVKWILYKYFNLTTSFHFQYVANLFMSVHWFAYLFLHHHNLTSTSLGAKGRKVGSYFSDFFMKAMFNTLQVFFIMSCYSTVRVIDQLPNFLNIWHDPKVDNTMLWKDLLKD